MQYYEVAPVTTVRTNKPTLTYAYGSQLAIGQIVRISIGKKPVNGVVLSKVAKPSYETKPVEKVIEAPLIPAQLIALAEWLSNYYLTLPPIVWQTLLPRGLEKNRRSTAKAHASSAVKPLPKLRKQQTAALQRIGDKPQTALLHGITGSGKTYVYIARALAQLNAGKSSIILVPEIGLTAQLIKSFEEHVSPVFVTHSRMSESKRHSAWKAIGEHDGPCVIIGPRSALFSPRNDIGLIVIDEFHEPSYKQDQNPKYSAIRAAAMLANAHKAQLLLGSATPSISEKFLAEQKNSSIISMDQTANHQATAQAAIIDLKVDKPISKGWLSLPAKKAIDWALKNDRQVLIFHNRRGTASTNMCNDCGWVAQCPNCFLPLTLHADWHQLRCHICDHKAKPFTSCPDCKNTELVFRGMGTKQLEADMASLYPNASIARFDTDNTSEETLDQRYAELHAGSVNIIIGTQTIAKGLDLPKLDVVVVPLADVGLFIPDYTSSERTFQLLHQVAGRVGRHSSDGKVIIQTYSPDQPSIQLAVNNDYDHFYQHELQQRKLAKYPPFVHMMKITAEYASAAAARDALRKLAGEITAEYSGLQILGPAPSFHERFHNKYRWTIVIKSRSRAKLQELTNLIPSRYHIDIDPNSLL